MPRTKESGIDGIETNPEEIAAMALYGLVIKEVEVETLAKGYMALRRALEEVTQAASFDRGHPTFDKIAAKAGAALEYRP